VRFKLTAHTASVGDIAFSPDGSRLASASYDQTAIVWDLMTGTVFHTLKGHMGAVMSVDFSPDGVHVATGSGDGLVKIWSAVSGHALASMNGHGESVNVVAYSPRGDLLASGSGDCFVRIWDPTTHAALHSIETSSEVRSMTFSADGLSIVAGGYNGSVVVYAPTAEVRHEYYLHSKPCHGVARSHNTAPSLL
jgi:WD40 repeat protein